MEEERIRKRIAQKIKRVVYQHKVMAQNAGWEGDRLEFEWHAGFAAGAFAALTKVIRSAACVGCDMVYPTRELKVSTGLLKGQLVCGYCWDIGR